MDVAFLDQAHAGAKFIEHTLAIADFMVGLEINCRERGDIKLLHERDILATAPERTQKSREPLRLVLPGLSNKMGVSWVIADGLFGPGLSGRHCRIFLARS